VTVGKVRVLSPNTPNVPPSIPYNEDGYAVRECPGWIKRADLPSSPLMVGAPLDLAGFYCTRPEHGVDTPHVCHWRDTDDGTTVPTPPLRAIIVWDAE
jgi:hypothetical protein